MAIGGITNKPKPKRRRPERIHVIRGRLWSAMSGVPLTLGVLRKLGTCMVAILSEESKRYFAKRGWTGKDPMGGPDLWDSFSFRIINKMDVEIRSTFFGMKELAHGSIPSRRMVWLTQEYKEQNPEEFPLTPREKELGMKKMSRSRMPLIVPIKVGGNVEFRTAPLKIGDAWVHPGIAKFTFFETAIRKGRKACIDIIKETL